MINASSPANRDVPTYTDNVIPLTLKTASAKFNNVTCEEIPDISRFANRTRNKTPNNELLLAPNELSHPEIIETTKCSIPSKRTGAEIVLDQIRSLQGNRKRITSTLSNWINSSRTQEINQSLVNALLFLDRHLALNVLTQLKEPKALLGFGDYKDKSFVIPTTLSSIDDKISVTDDASLLDTGATGSSKGYISPEFAESAKLPLTPLPYPIPVYNVDGTLNASGSIKYTCTTNLTIGDHVETITLRVTNTGSSNVILGLEWLRLHNPLVDWKTCKLYFVQCPPSCGKSHPKLCDTPVEIPPSTLSHPDEDHVRSFTETLTDINGINAEWYRTVYEALSPDDEALLCVDPYVPKSNITATTNMCFPKSRFHLKTPQNSNVNTTNRLRKVVDPSSGTYHYLNAFPSVFSEEAFSELPPRRTWDHAIELKPDANLNVKTKTYALSRAEQIELDQFIDDHLKSGRIQPSKSPLAAPFFFIKKKDGSLRPVQDYRKLNEMTIKNRYPLPLVSELMDKLKSAKYFTKLDIRWGYNNVRIKAGDEWKAAFLTNRGLFEPTVMFFGLTNSPATFQAMMNDLFHDLILTDHVIIYMDDILIFTDDLRSHRDLTRRVLQVLKDNNLFLKPQKCVFEASEVDYLGVIVSHGKIKMDPAKISALQTWPTPRNKKDVQQFLGFVNFYRRFIRDFAKTAKPLNRLCGDSPWIWTTTEEQAFLSLRDSCVAEPTLFLPLDNAPFRIEADSSGFATGAVLSQLHENVYRPVAFFSKALSDVERNYDIHDRELLSIMRSLHEWRRYLHGAEHPVEIVSDHKNLLYFMSNQKLNRRQARWSLELAEFNFILIHKPGSTMICADALSRRPDYDKGDLDNNGITLLQPHHIRRTTIEYTSSPLIEKIRFHASINRDMYQKQNNKAEWSFQHGLTTWHNRIFVPNVDNLREQILEQSHTSPMTGHPGRSKTAELVLRDFWWPTITKDCNSYVDGCATCQRSKPLRQKPLGLLAPNAVPDGYWQIISVDFVTDLPKSKTFDSIMVCIDRLSKMVRIIPCHKTITSESASRKYRDHVWKDFGLPHRIISDRGPQFVSSFTRSLNSLFGITENFSTVRHPQTDGQTERFNQEIEQFLRIFCNHRQTDWAEWLACAEFSLNNKINASTGYSPFFLNYGRHPTRPLLPLRSSPSSVPRADLFAKQMSDLATETKSALKLANDAMKRSYDAKHRDSPPLSPGSLVLLDARGIDTQRPSRKLDDKRHGPFEVVEPIGATSYRLRLPSSWKIHDVFHVSKLTPFRTPSFTSQHQHPSIPDLPAEARPTLHSVLHHKQLRNRVLYLALLTGDAPEDAKWIPHSDLITFDDPTHALQSYRSSL